MPEINYMEIAETQNNERFEERLGSDINLLAAKEQSLCNSSILLMS